MECKKMNVLSLFDGISCGQVALERAGIPVENYYASEIDPHAIKVTQSNYPNTKQIGSVVDVRGRELPRIDLLMGGSPCQGFSFAGKQLNFDDPRSKLFFEFVRLKEETNPKWWLLENVRMKKEYQDVISEYLGVEPVFIDSADFSAQTRKRLYWTNIPVEKWEARDVVLSDILDGEWFSDRDKSYCIDANYGKGGNPEQYFNKSRRQLVFMKQLARGWNPGFERETHKTPTFTTSSWPYNNLVSLDKKDWRILSPVECERLQTLPDEYTRAIPKTRRYHGIGNGWTVDVVAHIFRGIEWSGQATQ